MDISSLEGPHPKFARAQEQLRALDTEMSAFLRTNPYSHIHEEHPEGPNKVRHVLIAQINADPPAEWPLLVGEIVSNLRSALDHLAFMLAHRDGPPSDPTKIAFPVCKSEGYWNSQATQDRIAGIREEAVAVIKTLQPYTRPDDPLAHPLAVLDELWNIDKHRKLHVVRAAIVNTSAGINAMQDVEFFGHHFGLRDGDTEPGGGFKDGAELASWSVEVTGPDPQVDMNVQITFGVALEPEGPARGELLIPTLVGLRNLVAGALRQLRRFLAV